MFYLVSFDFDETSSQQHSHLVPQGRLLQTTDTLFDWQTKYIFLVRWLEKKCINYYKAWTVWEQF